MESSLVLPTDTLITLKYNSMKFAVQVKISTNVLKEKLKGRDHLRDISRDWMIILKILKFII
jgi:hypothetical protein